MALNETIGPGTPQSSAVAPSGPVSEYAVGSYNTGTVVMEQLAPGGDWIPLDIADGAGVIDTPDTAVQYRFNSSSLKEDVHVYFGP